MTSEFGHVIAVSAVVRCGEVAVAATPDQCRAVAARLDLLSVDALTAAATLRLIADGVEVRGTVRADIVQPCAASGEPLPARINAPFHLSYVRDIFAAVTDAAVDADGLPEIELDAASLEQLPLEDEQVDIGEIAVQTLALAIDPFARHQDADRFLAAHGVISEAAATAAASPFAGLAGLKRG